MNKLFSSFLMISLFFLAPLFSVLEDSVYVCAIFQNEERFLAEWVQFHLDQGVEKIYMYNNKSNDGSIKVLQPYVDRGDVILIDWHKPNGNIEQWGHTQCSAYKDCAMRCIDKCGWVAFIDTDEFLFSPEGQKLNHVMREYRECAAIGVNWVMYGTSQVQHVPEGHKIVDHLVYRSELSNRVNRHIKSIVRPKWFYKCASPHHFVLNFGAKTVNENKQPIEGAFSDNSVNKLRINHYWSRDMDFFLTEKLIRRKIWSPDQNKHDQNKQINMEKTYNVVYDPILANQ